MATSVVLVGIGRCRLQEVRGGSMGSDHTGVRAEPAQTKRSWRDELVAERDRAQAELHRILTAEGDSEEWL